MPDVNINLILLEMSESGSWTEISGCNCENLSLCFPVTGSLGSCCPPDTSPLKMASCGTACSAEGARWPSDLHACPTADISSSEGGTEDRCCWPVSMLQTTRLCFCVFFWTEFWHQICTLRQLCGRTSSEEHIKHLCLRCLFMQRFCCHV